MNRRNLIKAIPSISLLSVPEFDMRKLYLQFIFPSEFTVEKVEIHDDIHYSAVWLDAPQNRQYYYYYNTHSETHKYVVQRSSPKEKRGNLVVRYTDTTRRAYKELEEYLP